jgi:hypothetical protein
MIEMSVGYENQPEFLPAGLIDKPDDRLFIPWHTCIDQHQALLIFKQKNIYHAQ